MRRATCRCGQFAVDCAGEPVRVSVCHCLDCQRRSGSAFAAQARFSEAAVTVTGVPRTWRTVRESGRSAEFSFCDTCGSTLYRKSSGHQDGVAVMIGGVDSDEILHASKPQVEIYTSNRPNWVTRIEGADQQEGKWHPKPGQLPEEPAKA